MESLTESGLPLVATALLENPFGLENGRLTMETLKVLRESGLPRVNVPFVLRRLNEKYQRKQRKVSGEGEIFFSCFVQN